MQSFLQSALSGRDNTSIDIGRVLWAVSTLALIALEAFSVVANGRAFDAPSFAAALAGVSLGNGATLRVKANTEPAGQSA